MYIPSISTCRFSLMLWWLEVSYCHIFIMNCLCKVASISFRDSSQLLPPKLVVEVASMADVAANISTTCSLMSGQAHAKYGPCATSPVTEFFYRTCCARTVMQDARTVMQGARTVMQGARTVMQGARRHSPVCARVDIYPCVHESTFTRVCTSRQPHAIE